MDASQHPLKNISRIALAAMGALFVVAIIYYKERSLFADAAFVIFHIINEKNLVIQENRYGSFVTQMFPDLGQKLHLSVKTILVLYGISFNLFYFSVSAILYKLKQYYFVILMALYYFLFFSESFIWISEIPQGIAWMFLLFGVTLYLWNKKANILLLSLSFILFAALALFSHFVIAIPFIFLWVYFIIEKNNWPFSKGISILLSSLIVFVIIVKFLLSGGQHGPESSQLYGVTHFSLKDVIESFTKPVVQMFFYRCLVNYWPGTLVFIIGIAALIKNRQRTLAIWTIASTLGYIIIMGLTYGNLDSSTRLFHIESEWTSIGIIIAAPFVFTFLPKLKSTTAAWLLAGIFIIRFIYIISFFPPFTARNNMKEQLLSQMRKKGIKKLALINDEHLRAIAILDWALPYESVLMSSVDGDKPQLTFLFVNPDDKHTLEELQDPKIFFNVWDVIPCNKLNKE